ncbi:beta-propeller domain-containing protein [Embleya sp. NPDC020630]|uniref:beta-propeller domain-containing protein n=1 Tax=Embleya sp. NPDC020630 TaxID=3363979 RepID=UPI00379BCED8
MRIHDGSTRGAAALPIFVLAAGLVVGGCTSSGGGSKPDPERTTVSNAESARLSTFDSCGALVDDFRAAALRNMPEETRSVPIAGEPVAGAPAAAPNAAEGKSADLAAPAAPTTPEHSTTNTQEVGVDEPDLVKSDGRRVLTVANGRLTVVDTATHRVTGSLAVPGARATEMLLSGDRALLILDGGPSLPKGKGGSGKMAPIPGDPGLPGTNMQARFVLVDLTGAPRTLGDLTVDGAYADARQVGSTARIVVRSRPRLNTSTYRISDRDKAVDRIRRSTVGDWLPQFTLAANGRTESGNLVGCDRVSRPASRAGEPGHTGAATLSVLSFDLTRDLDKGDPVTVAADVNNVYASESNLYLATTTSRRDVSKDAKVVGGGPPTTTTAINQLDISGKGTPKPVATGVVSGTMVNQYAMSELGGNLRVATTLSPGDPTIPQSGPGNIPPGGTTRSTTAPGGSVPGAPGTFKPGTIAPSAAQGSAAPADSVPGSAPNGSSGSAIAPSDGTDTRPTPPSMPSARPPTAQPPIAPRSSSESAVTVLARNGDKLTQIGRVGGLGRTERIMGVRFAGPIAYVVTFRQTDPLYTIDLSDPRNPRTVGELKINGYSAYLHPIADGRLIGVGQDATDGGMRLGTQVSLFDVHTLADPTRVAQYTIPSGSSQAEQDAHAFLYWPKDGTVVVPVTGTYSMPDRTQIAPGEKYPGMRSSYALVLRVDGTRIVEVGRVTHPDSRILRSLVVGDELWTVSAAGISVDRLADVRQVAWIPIG